VTDVTTAPDRQARKASRSRKPTPPACRVTAWARRVAAGEVVAGPGVRDAAARHLRDLEAAPARGLRWDAQAADHACAFFEEVLHLNGGAFEGQPFRLLGWQVFVVGSLHGWRRADGTRRFRVAYVETGKGSGKSPLAAGIGLHGLTADGEPRAEIYAAATKRDQAMVLFRDAVAMYQQSPALAQRLTSSGVGEKTWNLAYLATGSFFRPIAADQGQSGPRPHVALVDELHEHPTNHVIEMLRAGFKSRRQPLLFAITNSGHDKTSTCGQYHDYALQVAAGIVADDAFFAFVCNLDDGDDPFADETCWPKANPSLQEANLPGLDYLRQQVTEARNLPSKQSLVRRLNFCQWTHAEAPWLSPTVWMPAAQRYTLDQFRGRRVYAGLDLSSTTDLTALTLAIQPEAAGEPWRLLAYAWVPAANLEQRERDDKVPYTAWVRDGHLLTTPGAAINKLLVLQRLAALCEHFEVAAVAYDRWRIADLRAIAEDAGIELPPLVEFGQGFRDMAPAIDAFETALLAGELVHNSHPVLTWCAANAVIVEDDAGNRKLSKRKASGRIDSVLAAVMAIGVAQSPPAEELSVYDVLARESSARQTAWNRA
jgi:phage terminase large subunit-like protein